MAAFSRSTAPIRMDPAPGVVVPAALSIPVIEETFHRQLHPYWPRLRETTRAWLLDKRLMAPEKVERYADELRYTDLVAGYYIGAPDDLLSAIADFSSWFFAWDDRHDRDVVHGRTDAWRHLCRRLHTALDAPVRHLNHPDPLVAAFADCVLRIHGRLGLDWNARFARHFHPVIDAYDREFDNRRTGTVPTVAEYVELRRLTFAHWIWIDLLEACASLEIPVAYRKHPAYRQAALATQDFSAWYNDLCSLPKELAGDELHNLGISLIQHDGLSLEEAVAELRRRVIQCTADFLLAEKEVERLAHDAACDGTAHGREVGAALTSCVRNMRNWFSSVYWFHHESGRYQVDSWDDRATPPYLSDPAGES